MNDLTVLTERDIRENVNLIQRVMKAVMKKDVHFGLIPGCPKPSLFKPGAEKIASTFRIAVTSDVEDLSTTDEKRYRITCTAYAVSGNKLGSAIGECSSSEEKYRWRRPVCDKEWEEAEGDRKREKWLRDGTKIKQMRTEPSDLANTILQMADKRAYVAVVRKVTAASDVFTQDIEDLPEEVQADIATQQQPTNGKPPVQMPQEKQPSTEIPVDGKRVISEKQGNRLLAIASTNGYTKELILEYVKGKYALEHLRDITTDIYDAIVAHFEGKDA